MNALLAVSAIGVSALLLFTKFKKASVPPKPKDTSILTEKTRALDAVKTAENALLLSQQAELQANVQKQAEVVKSLEQKLSSLK